MSMIQTMAIRPQYVGDRRSKIIQSKITKQSNAPRPIPILISVHICISVRSVNDIPDELKWKTKQNFLQNFKHEYQIDVFEHDAVEVAAPKYAVYLDKKWIKARTHGCEGKWNNIYDCWASDRTNKHFSMNKIFECVNAAIATILFTAVSWSASMEYRTVKLLAVGLWLQ